MRRTLTRMTVRWRVLAVVLVLAALAGVLHAQVPTSRRFLDPAAWTPMEGSPRVAVVRKDGGPVVQMPCTFAGHKIERASWDLNVSMDLAAARGLQFQACCTDLTPVDRFTIYLHSGPGWYTTTFTIRAAATWTTCRLRKTGFSTEGTPAGWDKIDLVRISAWRGGATDSTLFLRDLNIIAAAGPIVILRADSADPKDGLLQYADALSERLEFLNLDYTPLSDLHLQAADLKDKKLVILPFNPDLGDQAAQVLVAYLRGGGKLLAFYQLPDQLAEAAGIDPGQFIRQKTPGNFASIRPVADCPIVGLPRITGQGSWNIMAAKPLPGRGRVAAEWFDADGRNTGLPAIVVSDRCVLFTHVLLPDDAVNKGQLLMALLGHAVPELWVQAANASLDRIGRIGPYSDLPAIRAALAGGHPEVQAALDQAGQLQSRAAELCRGARYPEAIALAEQANQKALEACCRAQRPVSGERRAFWCHSPFGVQGMDWDQAIKLLAANGFTAIHPNMLWGGLAFYPSAVLPVAPEVKTRGDQIAACLAACRKYGIECHVWKVNWALGGQAPREFILQLRAAGRLQHDFAGHELDWLCPSDPANQKLEADAMVEVATKYDVDGVHYDYIRYPDEDACFCPGCRERFEKTIGRTVAHWPADVRRDPGLREPWLEFRRGNITAVVAAVSRQLRATRPKVKISAAVFADWASERDAIGQDWKLWCDKGYLDFVCPMDYTPSPGLFRGQVEREIRWAGKVRCYPGIGYSCFGAEGDLFTLFEEVGVTRRLGTGGFTIFNYEPSTAEQVVPYCGMGLTAKP